VRVIHTLHIINFGSHGILVIFRDAQLTGIWAWDAAQDEPVLVFPSVFGLLGDNPMQSELACHIGLHGKFFCRCCWVKGKDADEVVAPSSNPLGVDHTGSDMDVSHASDSSLPSEASVARASVPGSSQNGRAKKSRQSETLQQIVDRAKRFLGVSVFSPVIA